jgi:hypothetical protein
LPLETGELPHKYSLEHRDTSVCCCQGSKHVNIDRNDNISPDPIAPSPTQVPDESTFRYTSDSYQKILDYHVSEILLTTIIFGLILLLRFHR